MTARAKQEIDFSVFMLHKLAAHWNVSAPEAYRILADTGIIQNYIIGCYDTLHTLGAEYLVDDITGFVREKGIDV